MSAKTDGGPAFPLPVQNPLDPKGMSLRDYFAAAALQGFLANIGAGIVRDADKADPETAKRGILNVGSMAFIFADAMLGARKP